MRDPKRIDVVLAKIREEWTKYPDLRLMQLLVNVLGVGDHFYVEDEEFLAKLAEYAKNTEG